MMTLPVILFFSHRRGSHISHSLYSLLSTPPFSLLVAAIFVISVPLSSLY